MLEKDKNEDDKPKNTIDITLDDKEAKFIIVNPAPTKQHYHVYINTYIESDQKWYRPLLQLLHTSTENDVINVHLNSGGGELWMALEIMSALQNSPAELHLDVSGCCASAATLLTFGVNWKTMTVNRFTSFLFHSMTYFAWGKQKEIYDKAVFNDKYMKFLFAEIYKDILTDSERESIVEHDKELYLMGYEIEERLINRNMLREKRKKKESK